MPWFKFHQNNSGGQWSINEQCGIGQNVWVEARDADHANERAEAIGIYFNGCCTERDCPCCGDRWYEVSEHDAETFPTADPYYQHIYAHHLDGGIQRIVELPIHDEE